MVASARLFPLSLSLLVLSSGALAQPSGTESTSPPAAEGQAPAPSEDAPPPAEPPAQPEEATAPGEPAPVPATPTAPGPGKSDRKRAEAFWDQADELYSGGRYREAIEQYLQAYELLEDSELLYSIATTYQQLENWQECVNYMDRFLAKARHGPKRDRAANARKSCDARISRDQLLIIESDPPAAKVYIDDRSKGVRGSTPFRNYVRPGAHIVWVELPGYEPIRQEIEVQVKEPFRINVAMRRVTHVGWMFVDCTITGAKVFIDGKNVGLSPFKEPLSYPDGRHQVVVERDGYTRFDKHVSVHKGETTVVDAYLVRTEFIGTWRTSIGWTANVVGLLSLAGGVVAWQFADREFNDTDRYDELAGYEKLGHGVGGGLLGLGFALIVWDRARDVIIDEHRNPDYSKPPEPTQAHRQAPVVPALTPTGLGLSFEF